MQEAVEVIEEFADGPVFEFGDWDQRELRAIFGARQRDRNRADNRHMGEQRCVPLPKEAVADTVAEAFLDRVQAL